MEVIPVIDLLNGHVVHAQRGQRSLYKPISTPLCASSEPLAVVQALLGLYPFERLYIADLDAIQHQGDNAAAIREIRTRYPSLDIWLDGGLSRPQEWQAWHARGLTCVIGSENLASSNHSLNVEKRTDQPVLSLDFGLQGYMGPDELLGKAHEWPDKVIVMTLARVGSSEGPDLHRLMEVIHAGKKRTPAPKIYAAGGMRHLADLQALSAMGVSGALVATALHHGDLKPEHIAALESA